MAQFSKPEIEAYKAKQRIKFYLAGGSRPVFISRGILSAVLVVCWLVIWWQGSGS
jgi:hypothetical protein